MRSSDGPFANLLTEFALSSDEVANMERCLRQVQKVVRRGLGPEWGVEKFGSVPNNFGTRGSDLDLTVVSTASKEDCDGPVAVERLRDRLQPLFQEHANFKVVQEIYSAKVPILKLRFAGCLDVDISYMNVRALRNTRLLKAYASLDPVVQGLVIAVKLWAKSAGVCGAAERNLSSYAFTLMVIYYLQIDLQLPSLPTDAFQPQGRGLDDPRAASMVSSWKAPVYGASSLVWGFFRFYASRFAWGREVVSVRLGKRTSKGDERFKRLPHRSAARLHIEDPYELDRNLHCVLGSEQEEKLIAALRKASAGSDRGVAPSGLGRLWGCPPSAPPAVRAVDFAPPTPPRTPQTLPSASPPLPPPLHSASATAAAAVAAPPAGDASVRAIGEGVVAEQAPVAAGARRPRALDDCATIAPPEAVSAISTSPGAAALLSTTPIARPKTPPSPATTGQEADRSIMSSPYYYAGVVERTTGGCAVPATVEQPQALGTPPAVRAMTRETAAARAVGDADGGAEGKAAFTAMRWLGTAPPTMPPGPTLAAAAEAAAAAAAAAPAAATAPPVGGDSSSSPLSDDYGAPGGGDGDVPAALWRHSAGQRSTGAKRAGSNSSTCAADSGSGASVGAQTDSEDTAFTAFDSGSMHDSGVGEASGNVAPPSAAAPEQQQQTVGLLARKWWQNMDSERVQMAVEEAMGIMGKAASAAPPPRRAPMEAKVFEGLHAAAASAADTSAHPEGGAAVGGGVAAGVGGSISLGGPSCKSTSAISKRLMKAMGAAAEINSKPAQGAILLQ